MIIQSESNLCPENKPFRLNDQSCENLASICFKTEYDQCNQLLVACKQCPPSNLTLTMLRNIWEMSIVQSNLTQQIINKTTPNAFEQFISTMTNKSKDLTPALSNDYCAILLWIIIIILTVHFLTTHFKLFRKCFQICRKKDYVLIKSRKRKYLNDIFNKISELESRFNESIAKIDRLQTPSKDYLDEIFELKFQKLIDRIDCLQTPSKASCDLTDIKFATIQLQFDDVNQEPIDLFVHNTHNIVQVKQQICTKLPHANHDDYKIMKLKYNGIILNDDNQYLLEIIDKSNAIVNCFIDSSMNASDIVVVKLQGKMRLPDIIQINKNQTIDQLKELIGKIINSNDFSLFKEFINDKKQMKKALLKLDSACLENNLWDGVCMRIVQTFEGELMIKSIFDEKFCIPATYKNTNQISSLIDSVKNSYNLNTNNFVLFCNNQYLEEDKFICEYDICADSPVKICNLAKIEGIDKRDTLETDTNWELFHATKPPNNMKILLKKYKNITLENWKSQDWMINELKTFLVTKNHPRFIQLFGVYFEKFVYVAMENMEKGTLKNYLKKNKNFEKTFIYKWSKQIIQGLEYLHNNNVVHRHLNPSNILVNNNIDLKLSSFNLCKYESTHGPPSFIDKPKLLETVKVRYMAPELLNGEEYKFPCDIWSFGAVLLRIASGKKPLPKICKEDAKQYIINNGIVEYDLSEKYKSDSELKSIIDSCLKRNPDERCKIENLLKD